MIDVETTEEVILYMRASNKDVFNSHILVVGRVMANEFTSSTLPVVCQVRFGMDPHDQVGA